MDIAAMSMQLSQVQLAQQMNYSVMKLAMEASTGMEGEMLGELMDTSLAGLEIPSEILSADGHIDMYI